MSGKHLNETSLLREYVGGQTVQNLLSGCYCENEKYGPFCSWSVPNYDDENVCNHGRRNNTNFLSGCECRNNDGKAIAYHGWYCETHNKALCTGYLYKDKFYDVNSMNPDKVGDCCDKVCRSCDQIFGEKCAECQQDKDTNCES